MTKAGGGAPTSGAFLGSADFVSSIPFTLGNTTISMRFFSPVAGLPVRLNLRGPAPKSITVNAAVVGWQILEFDFASVVNISDPYNGLELYPGWGLVPGVAQVSYVDNIVLGRFQTNVWRGTTSTDFLKGSNWSLGFAPLDCNMDVQVNAGTPFSAILASGSYGAGNVDVKSGATLTVNSGATYSICGNIINGTIGGAGTVVFNGANTQSIAGTHEVGNVTITKPAASGVVTINGTVKTKGLVTLSNANSSIVVGGSGKLILASDASGTGSIATIPAGASVTGNVTQQRYLTGSNDGWYFVGTPITGGNFSEWSDNMQMVAGTNLGGNQGVIPTVEIERSTIFKYDDAFHNVSSDTVQKRGWRVPEISDALTVGQGFRVWLKSYNSTNRTLDNVGPITSGAFSFPALNRTEPANCQINLAPVTIACDESFRGWNFLANPLPSAIDWDATGGAWTKPGNMLNGFYRWNKTGYGVYSAGSYAGTGPAPTNPSIIASGQGFFVKVQSIGAAVLSLNENAKSNNANSFLRTSTATANVLKMKLEKVGLADYNFMAEVRFNENATDGKDMQLDVPNFAGNNFQFTMPVGNEEMIINSLAPITSSKVVPLKSKFNGSMGMHKFVMSGIESFDANTFIFLRDNWTGTLENISNNQEYSFEVNPSNIGLEDRFELVFTPDGVTGTTANLNGLQIGLYPNPTAENQVMLSIKGNESGKASIYIVDVLGKVVSTSELNLTSGNNSKLISLDLASGLYTVKITTATKTVSQKLIVR